MMFTGLRRYCRAGRKGLVGSPVCGRVTCLVAALVLVFSAATGSLRAAGNPGPGPTDPSELPVTLTAVHITVMEVSWDFGDVAPPDWRKELVSSDTNQNFRLRWKYAGPGFASAVLSIYDDSNQLVGDVPLPLTPVSSDGYRYTTFLIGDLLCPPTLTLHVRILDADGTQVGCTSNEAQITAEGPGDPFLYTPLFTIGLSQDFGVPGIVGAVSCENLIGDPDVRVYVDGVRKFDGGADSIHTGDQWAIGSCTKAMTCTLMGLLIQQGTPVPAGGGFVNWDTPLTDIFPEWGDLHARFSYTTLRHLACHRSGLRMTWAEDSETRVIGEANDDPRTFRREMTHRLLKREHAELTDTGETGTEVTTVGTNFFYGSGNYLVLGAVIERLTNQAYEQAIAQRLFLPLGIMSASFGMPVHDNVYYQPHGHYRTPDFPHETVRDNLACPPVWNPAGSCYLSVQDWLRFLRLHIDGTEGSLTLTTDTLAELHTPYPHPADNTSYGFGWRISSQDGDTVLDHNGHYFRFFARCRVHIGRDFACLAIANMGPNEQKDSAGNVIWADKSSINAVNMLLGHIKEKAMALQDVLGLPKPGTFAAGSGASPGILHITMPEDAEFGSIIDNLGDPRQQISLDPADYAPVCLYQHDVYHRLLAADLRRPKPQAFDRAKEALFRLLVNTERGAIYQLWRISQLHPRLVRELDDEVMALSETTEFLIEPAPEASFEFFSVSDLVD